jgi:hypothetical protein
MGVWSTYLEEMRNPYETLFRKFDRKKLFGKQAEVEV